MATFYKRISPNNMTANNAPASYVVSRSSAYSAGYEAWKAFDGKNTADSDRWATPTATLTGWIALDIGSPDIVNNYTIQSSPYYNTSNPRDWTFQGSNNGTDWTILHTVTNQTGWATSQTKEFSFTNEAAYRYYKLDITANNGFQYLCIGELEFRYDHGVNTPKHYYVSQQRGNDSNNGLTPETPWATITKAVQSIQMSTEGNTYIYIGPGTYRESLILVYGGTDDNHKIIYQGDPECLYVTGDNPGNVRLTSANSLEVPTAGVRPLTFATKTYVEFWNFDLDGSPNTVVAVYSGANAIYNGEILYNCRISGRYGPHYLTCYNCTSVAALYNFYGCVCYNCIGIGGNVVFTGTNYNCLAIGGTNSFSAGTNINCIAVGSGGAGFVTGTNSSCYNVFSDTPSVAGGVINAGTNFPIALFDIDFDWLLSKGIQDIGANIVTKDIINNMTSNTTPAGIASCSSIYDVLFEAWKAFNGTVASGDIWATSNGVTTGWLAYEFPTPRMIANYSITGQFAAQNRSPRDWTFEGWDESNWIVLDTRTNVTNWIDGTYNDFWIPLENIGLYKKYRINVTANNGNAVCLSICELKMAEVNFYVDMISDINGAPRIMNGTVDAGPWEASNVSMDFVNAYDQAPAIKINGQSQVILDVASDNGYIDKSIWVKNAQGHLIVIII
jgi:hypothetical protein